MEKNIRDYLPFYIGCDVEYTVSGMRHKLIGIESDGTAYIFGGTSGRHIVSANHIKPLLRPLDTMTEEEAINLYRLTSPYGNNGFSSDVNEYDVTYMRDCKLGKEHPNYGHLDAIQVIDLRTPYDYMNLNCKWEILRYNHENGGEPQINFRVPNQQEATRFLLSKFFDLFNLIPEALALDATKEVNHG